MKYSSLVFTFLFYFWLSPSPLTAQTTETKDTFQFKQALFALPLVFYTPETDWGFGAAGILAFRFRNNTPSARTSQLQLGFAYTLEKQFLSYLPFQIFFGDELYKVYGELGYYRYSYEYYGVGNEAPESAREVYGVNYPRIRINALRRIAPNFFGGLRYWLDDFDITKLDPEGQLTTGNVAGTNGGLLSGVGLVFNFDDRDNVFYPSKGSLAELVLFHNGSAFGSDFDFSKLYFDLGHYLGTGWGHILALNIYGEFTSGTPPFNQYALLGGTKRMRGYYEGRFRDKQMLVAQAEYRFPLFWLLKGAVFGGFGRVADSLADFKLDGLKYNAGAGLRVLINKKEQIHIRLDAAFGQSGNNGYYVTIGEAF